MVRLTLVFALACSIAGGVLWLGHEDEAHHDGEDAAEHGGQVHVDEIFGDYRFWFSVANFSCLLAVLSYLGAAPLSEHLKSRRREVERGIAEATELKAKAQVKYDEYSRRLETLDEELAKLRSDIETAADAEKKKIVADAEQAATRLKQDTEALIERQLEELNRQVTREVVEAAVSTAEQVVREAMNADDQRRLAEQFVKKVGETGKQGRT